MTRPTTGATIGIDVGGTKLAALMLDEAGEVCETVRVPTPSRPGDLLDALASAVRALRDSPPRFAVAGIGVGLPGLVSGSGRFLFSPHLPDAAGLEVVLELERRCELPVVAINDNRAAAWAEHRVGSGVGVSDVLYVGLGTGIGGGVVAGGRLLRGAHGFGGEIGHVVIDPSGTPCVCGRRGCWEQYASGSALGAMARRWAEDGRLAGLDHPHPLTGEHVTRAAALGHPGAIDLVGEFGRWVALGLANLTMIFDPEVIVVGGGVADPPEVVLGPVRRHLPALLGSSADRRPLPEIRAAASGPLAGAVGAALLARGAGHDPGSR